MQASQKLKKERQPEYIRYSKGSFSIMPQGIIEFMARVRIGSNGWPVMACLCRQVYRDGTLGAMPRETICQLTGMTPAQVSRGLADLRANLVIEPIVRRTRSGSKGPDRSSFGHVAQYRFTPEAWEFVQECTEGPTP